MIDQFVAMLMASSMSTPTQPTAAYVSNVSGEAWVNWTNAPGGFQTRIYRKTPYTSSTWVLIVTASAGLTSYDMNDGVAESYTYGVSHYNPSTLQESTIRTATAITPPTPSGSINNY